MERIRAWKGRGGCGHDVKASLLPEMIAVAMRPRSENVRLNINPDPGLFGFKTLREASDIRTQKEDLREKLWWTIEVDPPPFKNIAREEGDAQVGELGHVPFRRPCQYNLAATVTWSPLLYRTF